MPGGQGHQDIFANYRTPLTSLRFADQMFGSTRPGLCSELKIVSVYANRFTLQAPYSFMVNSPPLKLNPDWVPDWDNEDLPQFIPDHDGEPLTFKVTVGKSMVFTTLPTTVALGVKFIFMQDAHWFCDFDMLDRVQAKTYPGIILVTVHMQGSIIHSLSATMSDRTDELIRQQKNVFVAPRPVGYGNYTFYESHSRPLLRSFQPIYPHCDLGTLIDWKPSLFGWCDGQCPYAALPERRFDFTVYQTPSQQSSEDVGGIFCVKAGLLVDFAGRPYDADVFQAPDGSDIPCSYYMVGYRKMFTVAAVPHGALSVYAGPLDFENIVKYTDLNYRPAAMIAWTGSSLTSRVFQAFDSLLPADMTDLSFFKVDMDSVMSTLADSCSGYFYNNYPPAGRDGEIVYGMKNSWGSVGANRYAEVGTAAGGPTDLTWMEAHVSVGHRAVLQIDDNAAWYGKTVDMQLAATVERAFIIDEILTRKDLTGIAGGRYKGMVADEADMPAFLSVCLVTMLCPWSGEAARCLSAWRQCLSVEWESKTAHNRTVCAVSSEHSPLITCLQKYTDNKLLTIFLYGYIMKHAH